MELSIPYTTLIAGFFGAIVALSFIEQELSAKKRFSIIAVGVAAAYFLTPLIVIYLLKLTESKQINGGIAFLIGLTSMGFIPALIDLSKKIDLTRIFRINNKEDETP